MLSLSVPCLLNVPSLHPPFFFFNDPATTEIYTLSLHDALPIFVPELWAVHSVLAGLLPNRTLPEPPRVWVPPLKLMKPESPTLSPIFKTMPLPRVSPPVTLTWTMLAVVKIGRASCRERV